MPYRGDRDPDVLQAHVQRLEEENASLKREVERLNHAVGWSALVDAFFAGLKAVWACMKPEPSVGFLTHRVELGCEANEALRRATDTLRETEAQLREAERFGAKWVEREGRRGL
jgi:hypothetical protein